MTPDRRDLLQGTLDLLILQTLALAPLHGWGIARRIQQLSADALAVQQGSLYPALHRLQERGWIRSRLGESDEGRPVKIYRLTAAGRRRLAEERSEWRRLASGVEAVLAAAGAR